MLHDNIIIPRLLFEQLPDLCPNMETLDFDPETWKSVCFNMNVSQWIHIRQLPTLSTKGPSLPFLHCLGSGLSSLSIQSEMILDISTQNKLFSLLSLVPRITEFTIKGNRGTSNVTPTTLYLSLEDIELIHKLLPCLESFTITGNNIEMPIGELFNIENFPTAHRIKTLHWNTRLMPVTWLLFVTHKYSRVQDLVLAVQNHIPNISFPQLTEENALYIQLVQKCRHLKKISLSSPLLNDWFNASFLEDLVHLPHIQEVGPIVQKGNRIKFDTELALAALPENRRLITALEIEQWRLDMKLSCTLNTLRNFTKLAYLELKCDSYNDKYDLENLLDSCPRLENLVLEWGTLLLTDQSRKRHPLKSLCITYVAFEPTVFQYLSNKCRSLSTLLITKCKQLCELQNVSTQTVIQIDMPQNNFELILMDGIRLDYSNANVFYRGLSSYARVVSIQQSDMPVKWYQHVEYTSSNRKVPISQLLNDKDEKVTQDYFSQREQYSFVNNHEEEAKTNMEFGYIKIKCQSLRNFVLDGNFSC
ncbi:hypothetical protein INT47_012591 [Mucor saturninus]|uniref:Uncharacterized protein n=1 Tax=Mucor saturninus TaxID=64648 RepID=A0A8H7V3V7_9FUNG|nr:hypothetical protein INT47_012591 [Mucor saturninus]